MRSLESTRIADIMITEIFTVLENDTMEEVAQLFEERNFHSAPVLDKKGKCVGIITSHDLVEYEAVRKEIQNGMEKGTSFDMAHYGNGVNLQQPNLQFDKVGFHMSKQVDTARVDDSLSSVAQQMCKKHRHHVLVLNDAKKPIGLLSSLDLLGFVVDFPIRKVTNRTTN